MDLLLHSGSKYSLVKSFKSLLAGKWVPLQKSFYAVAICGRAWGSKVIVVYAQVAIFIM